MQILRYRRELARPLRTLANVYPYAIRTLRSTDVPAVHALLREALPAQGSALAPRDAWWQDLSSDPAFDAHLAFLVETPSGVLAAAGIARRNGAVRELAVRPAYRRLGLASALLAHICEVFERRGVQAVDLEARAGNQAAIALYEAMGMRRVGASF